jgi:hypothetical protein
VALIVIAGCRAHFDELATDARADSPTGDGAVAGCPAGYGMHVGLPSLYKLIPAAGTWFESEVMCEADGTHLIVIDNLAENNFARSLNLTSSEHVWLGGGDQVNEGTFVWVTGVPMTYTKWGPAEPNNTMGVEDVMEIDDGGLWNDEAVQGANSSTYHAICECDGQPVVPGSYCDTDSSTDCGTCGTVCMGGTACTNQLCQ